jgi:hypothetical protein
VRFKNVFLVFTSNCMTTRGQQDRTGAQNAQARFGRECKHARSQSRPCRPSEQCKTAHKIASATLAGQTTPRGRNIEPFPWHPNGLSETVVNWVTESNIIPFLPCCRPFLSADDCYGIDTISSASCMHTVHPDAIVQVWHVISSNSGRKL